LAKLAAGYVSNVFCNVNCGVKLWVNCLTQQFIIFIIIYHFSSAVKCKQQ